MENFYSSELNVQILIALMKAHGVRKVMMSVRRLTWRLKAVNLSH